MSAGTYIQEIKEPMVTIPISKYTDMVRRIQLLEDQKEIDRLQRELENLEAKRVEVLHKMFVAEAKLKEAGIE